MSRITDREEHLELSTFFAILRYTCRDQRMLKFSGLDVDPHTRWGSHDTLPHYDRHADYVQLSSNPMEVQPLSFLAPFSDL